MSFEETQRWAQEFRPEPVLTFSGPTILLLVAGIIIVLLFVWWIVLIFAKAPETSVLTEMRKPIQESETGDGEDVGEEEEGE